MTVAWRVALMVALLVGEVQSKCADHKSCGDCAGRVDFLIHCEWCTSSNTCYLATEASKCSQTTDRIAKSFDCPEQPPQDHQHEYDEQFTRTKVLPLIGASNGLNVSQVQACLDAHIPAATVYQQYFQVCDKQNNSCSAFLAVSPQDQAITLTYQGSKGVSQLLDEGVDFLFDELVPFPQIGGKVDKYYFEAFYVLWNSGVNNDLKTLMAQYPTFEFWVVGHSMGGALASITSAYVIKENYFPAEKVKMVTFGQPRTGDYDYAVAHDSIVNYRYRVIHNLDNVPHLPYQMPFTDKPFHHRFEVWYPNDMATGDTFQICERADDSACSNTIKDKGNSADHLKYFGYDLPTWYETGCAP